MGFTAVLKGMFPFISAAASMGGPFGAMAAQAVGKAIGVDNVEPTHDGVSQAIASVKDPAVVAALQKAEQDFQLEMAKLGFDDVEKILSLDAGDRANARAREIAVKDKLPAILAVVVTGGFFGLLFLMAYHQIPAASEKVIDIMIGSLGASWLSIINYYFGSSSGSADKTRILAQQGGK